MSEQTDRETRMMIDPPPTDWRPYAVDQLHRAERAEAGLAATKDALRHALLTAFNERTRAESAESEVARLRLSRDYEPEGVDIILGKLHNARCRAESAESDLRALREKVARVEALLASPALQSCGGLDIGDDGCFLGDLVRPLREVLAGDSTGNIQRPRMVCSHGFSPSDASHICSDENPTVAALSDPTTPDQEGGA